MKKKIQEELKFLSFTEIEQSQEMNQMSDQQV